MAKKSKQNESRLPDIVWLALQVTLCLQLVSTALYYNGHFTNPLIHKYLLGQHLALTAWFLFGVYTWLRSEITWPRDPFLLPGALLAGWALLRSLFTDKADAIDNAYIFVCFLSAYPLWAIAFRETRFRTLVQGTIVFIAFVMMLGSIRQLLTTNPAFNLPMLEMMTLAPGSYDRQELGSFMGHNIQSGAITGIGVLFAISFILRAQKMWQIVMAAIYIITGIVLIVLGGTRGVVLMLAPALIYLAVVHRGVILERFGGRERIPTRALIRLGAGLAAVLLLISVVMGGWIMISPKADWENSVFSRFVAPPEDLFSGTYPRVWWMSVLMITDNPLFGVGMSAWPHQYPFYQEQWFAENPDTWIGLPKVGFHTMRAHNDYLHIWAELGLPAIVLVVWMLLLFGKLIWRQIKHPNEGAISHGACASAIAVALHATVFFTFHIATTGALFIACLALASTTRNSAKPITYPLNWLKHTLPLRVVVIAALTGLYALMLVPNQRNMVGDYMARLYIRYSTQAIDTYNPSNNDQYMSLMAASYGSLQRATEITPQIGIYWYDLGKEAILRGTGTGTASVVRDGIRFLEQSLESYSFYVTFAELGKAHTWLWRLGGNSSDWDTAVNHYARAVSIMPTFKEGWAQLALLYARNNQAVESIELISELELRFPGFVENTILAQARTAEQMGDTEEAMFLVSLASASQPANYTIFKESIEFYQRVQRIDLGADIYVNTVEFHQSPEHTAELVQMLTELQYGWMAQRRYEDAYQTVSQVQGHPLLSQDRTYWLMKAIPCWLTGRPYEALAAMHTSIKLGTPPGDVEPMVNPITEHFVP